MFGKKRRQQRAQEAQKAYEQALQKAARDSQWEAEKTKRIKKYAENRLSEVICGMQLDGIQADNATMRHLAALAVDGYRASRPGEDSDPAYVKVLIEKKYREALERRIFYNTRTHREEHW